MSDFKLSSYSEECKTAHQSPKQFAEYPIFARLQQNEAIATLTWNSTQNKLRLMLNTETVNVADYLTFGVGGQMIHNSKHE